VSARVRRAPLAAFLVALVSILVPFLFRVTRGPEGPAVTVVDAGGGARAVHFAELRRMSALTRAGSYQNQYGNWGGAGIYRGVRLADLLGAGAEYDEVVVRGEDGYEAALDRRRIEDPAYPVILAYALDGVAVPAWAEGFCIAVLPEDGGVSNEEYDAPSAGAFWVKNVTKITLEPRGSP